MACVKVAAPDLAGLLTTAQAKHHLRETLESAANDAFIDELVGIAYTAAEDRTGRSLLTTEWQLTLDALPAVITLPKGRIQSVDSVSYFDESGSRVALDDAAYVVDQASTPGRIVSAWGTVWPVARNQPGSIEVTFQAGYGAAADIPKPIVAWIKLALTDLYENRARSSDKPVVPQNFADTLLDTYVIWIA